jgi:phage tail tape-measure protein
MTYEQYKSAAAAEVTENDKTARMAGAGAGVIAGAQLGTVLLPIPIVGTFTGALLGGLVGTKIGKKVGGVLLDKMSTTGHSYSASAAKASSADVIKELERLAQLREAGVLSDDEFTALKAKMLGL